MSWHFTQDYGSLGQVDLYLDSMVCKYYSDLLPGGGDTPIPIQNGKQFWASMDIWYKSDSTAEFLFIFLLTTTVNGVQSQARATVRIQPRGYYIGSTLVFPHTTLNAPGLAPGSKIDVVKECYSGRFRVARQTDGSVFEIPNVRASDIGITGAAIVVG